MPGRGREERHQTRVSEGGRSVHLLLSVLRSAPGAAESRLPNGSTIGTETPRPRLLRRGGHDRRLQRGRRPTRTGFTHRRQPGRPWLTGRQPGPS